MKCKIFSDEITTNLENRINDFLKSGEYEIFKILQSESATENVSPLTITIFYRNAE